MKKLFFLFFFCVLLSGCDSSSFSGISSELSQNDVSSRKLLISELKRLDNWKTRKEAFDDTTNAFMFNNDLVIDLVQNPYSHFEFLEEEVAELNVPLNVKVLWIQLSQCLNDSSYFSLIDKVLVSPLNESDKLTLLRSLLSPGFEWGTRFSDNYFKEDYMVILKKISHQNFVNQELKDLLNLIIDGTNANYLKIHREIEGNYPRISCIN